MRATLYDLHPGDRVLAAGRAWRVRFLRRGVVTVRGRREETVELIP